VVLFIFCIILLLAALALVSVAARNRGKESGNSGVLVGAGVGCALLAIIVLLISIITTVGVGNVGVPVTFGRTGADLQPGIHLVAPWTNVVSMNVQTQSLDMLHQDGNQTTVRSSDNVSSNVDVSVLYAVDKSSASSLYRTVGVDYLNAVIIPTVRSALQDQSVQFKAVDLNAAGRAAYQSAVSTELTKELSPRGITVQRVLIREVDLPATVAAAAEAKVAAQQNAEAQQYALQTAQQQVAIAQQQAAANAALGASLTPQIICNNWVNAMAQGKITGPVYVTPCNTSSSGVNVLVPGK